MCGRFTFAVTGEQLMERYGLDSIPFEVTPRYNVAPGQWIPGIIQQNGKRRVLSFKWGLIPSRSKDLKVAYKMINARAETVTEKASYKSLFVRRRMIVPADGFFEWMVTEKGKQPMRIMLRSGDIFSMAGLHNTWQSPDGAMIHTCTIITTKPNTLVEGIHDRMPVILQPESESIWLNEQEKDTDLLKSLLASYDENKMKAYPVSTMVGNVKNDVLTCIEPFISE